MKFRAIISAFAVSLVSFALAYNHPITVKVTAAGHAQAGKSMTISVRIGIPAGYHIYGPKDIKTGVPTQVSVVAPSGFKVTKTSYPPTSTFEALGESVQVFKGEATVKVTVKAPSNAHGKKSFTVKVSSQACNDRTCELPSTSEATFSVNFS